MATKDSVEATSASSACQYGCALLELAASQKLSFFTRSNQLVAIQGTIPIKYVHKCSCECNYDCKNLEMIDVPTQNSVKMMALIH